MSVINWGIIGLGNIAYNFASAFEQVKNSKLISLASENNEKLEKFGKQFNIKKDFCYNGYDEILSNNEVDIIYIALPHSLHSKWIIKCIEAKKNILTEKPATINLAEIQKINQDLNKCNLFFAEGFMYRFHPQTSTLVEMIRQNEIGEINEMESCFGTNIVEKKNIFGFRKLKINKENRLFKKELGGGSILDLGCYPSSLSILIASLKSKGLENKVKLTDIKNTIGPSDVDLEAYVKLNFQNDFVSSISSSFKSNLGKMTKIIGSKGEIIIPDSWHCKSSMINVNGREHIINQKYKNIFSYEIESISNSLLNSELNPKFPAITRNETELNMNILDKWINKNET